MVKAVPLLLGLSTVGGMIGVYLFLSQKAFAEPEIPGIPVIPGIPNVPIIITDPPPAPPDPVFGTPSKTMKEISMLVTEPSFNNLTGVGIVQVFLTPVNMNIGWNGKIRAILQNQKGQSNFALANGGLIGTGLSESYMLYQIDAHIVAPGRNLLYFEGTSTTGVKDYSNTIEFFR